MSTTSTWVTPAYRRSAFEILSYPNQSWETLTPIWPELNAFSGPIVDRLTNDARYAVYLDRQAKDIEQFRREENLTLPEDLDFGDVAVGESVEGTVVVRPLRAESASQHTVSRTGLIDHMKKAMS